MNQTITPAYLNGEFLPLSQARVPVTDRGFLFGDAAYEVAAVYDGRLFRLPAHLQRLDRSLAAIRMANPLTHNEWKRVLTRLVAEQGRADTSVYLQVTRGAPADRDHRFPKHTPPTVFATTGKQPGSDAQLLRNGATAITLEDIRWRRCDMKLTALVANVLARQQAEDAGALEAILLRDGHAMECSASNVFVVRRDMLITPPRSGALLAGITRDVVLELAAEHKISYREAAIPESMLRAADEIWISSTTKEVVPVTRLDGELVGDAVPGPLWRRMNDLFQLHKRAATRD